MAVGVDFEGSNHVFGPPEGYLEEEIYSLPAQVDRVQSVSCWAFSAEEMDEIMRTGCVYVSLLYGGQQVPMNVSAFKHPMMKDVFGRDGG